MQNHLMEEMKHEYHKKVQILESEIKQLEKEKLDAMKKVGSGEKNKVEENYRKKVKDLEERLKIM